MMDPRAQQYGQAWSAAESRAYLESLKQRYKAEVRADAAISAAPAKQRAERHASSGPRRARSL